MYHGKYDNRNTRSRRRRRKGKSSLLLIALVVLMGVLVGSTVAYLVANTGSIANSFVPAKIETEITEDFKNNVKNDVKVQNTGDVDAYVRATVVVTWQNNKGEVYPTAPVEGTDYTVTYPDDTGWSKLGEYYYYTKVLKPNQETGVLLTDCKTVEGKAPEEYHLSVEILSSAIQSEPEDAIHEAWGVTIANGTVTTYTEGGNAE